MLRYGPKPVMASVSNEIIGLRGICAVFLREVLAGEIVGARFSKPVVLENSSCFFCLGFCSFFFEEMTAFVCLSIVQAEFHTCTCRCVGHKT